MDSIRTAGWSFWYALFGTRPTKSGDSAPSSQRRTFVIVAAILIATAAIVITMVTINAKNRAADEQKQRQRDHDASVSYYLGNYNQCGQAIC